MLTAALLLSMLVAQPGTPTQDAPTTPPASTPSKADPRDIADLLAPIVTQHKVPGMAAAVVLDGSIIAIGATGLREIGKPDAVTTSDLWHLGSCTKAMTATLAAVMVEKGGGGEIAWETTLGDVFPEVAMKDSWKPVTMRHLTTNRGGVPGGLDKDGLWDQLCEFKGTPIEARLALLTGVVAHEPEAAPGTKFIYSNGGFAMAGAMLERKSGKAWEDLIKERLFTPLGITTGGFGAPGDTKSVSQPRGHRGGKSIEPGPEADNPVAIGPAGIVHMSIADWARFVMAHAEGEHAVREGSTPLLKPDAFKFLHDPYPAANDADKERYAGGWLVSTRPWAKGSGKADTGRVLTHSGSNTMWHCVAWIAPERRFAVVVACNQGDREAPKANDDAASTLIQEFLVKK